MSGSNFALLLVVLLTATQSRAQDKKTVMLGDLQQQIKDGNYSNLDEHINETNFPSCKGDGTVQLVVISLGKHATLEEVLAYIKDKGLAPAKLGHLVAYGACTTKTPYSVIALGSPWTHKDDGNPYAPYIKPLPDGKRSLELARTDFQFNENDRFLAVMEKK